MSSQQQLQLPFQRWFCAALCPRQCASGCCAQPLPPFGLSSLTLPLLFSALSSAAVSALIIMLCGKVASQEVAVSCSSSCVPHDNPQLQTGLSVFSGRQQIGLFGSVFPPDFCISLRHGASMSHRFPIWLVKNKRDDLKTTAAWSFKEIFNYKQETFEFENDRSQDLKPQVAAESVINISPSFRWGGWRVDNFSSN